MRSVDGTMADPYQVPELFRETVPSIQMVTGSNSLVPGRRLLVRVGELPQYMRRDVNFKNLARDIAVVAQG